MKDKFSRSAFDLLYIESYPRLIRLAKQYTLSEEDAENIVQDVFMSVWETFAKGYNSYTFSYLFVIVRNKCLDYLRHRAVIARFEKNYLYDSLNELEYKLSDLESHYLSYETEEDLLNELDRLISELPERCREIFIKSKLEGKKYKEIAEEMEISEKTVENQVSIAMKKLNSKLNKTLLIFFLV